MLLPRLYHSTIADCLFAVARYKKADISLRPRKMSEVTQWKAEANCDLFGLGDR